MGRTIVGTDRAWQQKIQFEDEGVAVGTPGGVNTINFTGTGVVATEVGGTLTVDISGGGGSVAISVNKSWNFNSSLSGDPGTKKFLMNSATYASVTQLNISDLSFENFDIHALFDILQVGNTILIQQTDDATRIALFRITGTHTDMGGYHTLPVALVASSATLYQNNANCSFVFSLSASGGGTTNYSTIQMIEAVDYPDEPMLIPGPTGPQGPAGSNGVIGRDGVSIVLFPDDPEEPVMIPGPPGQTGPAGATGTAGRDGVTVVLLPDDPEDPLMVPGPQGPAGTAGVVSAPFIGNRATGSFTITTAQFGIHGKRLELTTTQRGTLQGAGRLSIYN